MRRQISVILFLAVLCGTSSNVLAKETTSYNELAWLDSQECIEEFMQEASLTKTEDNVYAFERISSVSPQMTRTRASMNIETYKMETLVLVPMEEQSSADLDMYLENIGTYSNARSISAGTNRHGN